MAIFVQRGEWVHEKSKDAHQIEQVFAALGAQPGRPASALSPEEISELTRG